MQCCCWCTVAADALLVLMHWCYWSGDASDARLMLICWYCWCADAANTLMLLASYRFWPWVYVLLALLVWWASGSGGGLVGLLVWWVLWVLIDKSPILRGQTCQGVLGLVFHRFPGTSIGSHYMPVKRAECFPFRDFPTQIQWDDYVGDDVWWTEEKRRCLSFCLAPLGFPGHYHSLRHTDEQDEKRKAWNWTKKTEILTREHPSPHSNWLVG